MLLPCPFRLARSLATASPGVKMPPMGHLLFWSVAGWIAVVPCAIANGALRELVLRPRLGVRVAQPISGVLGSIIIGVIVFVMVGQIGPRPAMTFLLIGGGWVVATLAFEFSMGFASRKSWHEMLAQYRFADNNLWTLVVLWIAVAPWLLARWRGLTE